MPSDKGDAQVLQIVEQIQKQRLASAFLLPHTSFLRLYYQCNHSDASEKHAFKVATSEILTIL